MRALSLAEIADVVGGRLHLADPRRIVDGPVALDSRAVVAGGLFAAFDGEHVDGHAYASAAVAAGAVAVLASREVPAPVLLVPDVQAALARLARHNLDGLEPLVVGITGSFGKTTTKDLLGAILQAQAPTVATAGSFNNELGLPLTVLRADETTRFLVLEMGAARGGDLRYLTSIAAPRVGTVLAVGNAHVETFVAGAGAAVGVGSSDPLDIVANAKAELVEALPPAPAGGIAVLNADGDLEMIEQMAGDYRRVAAMATRTDAKVVWFGRGPAAAIGAADERLIAGMPAFTLTTPDGDAPVRLSLLGAHQVTNALAAAATAWALGVAPDRIAEVLSGTGPRSRSRLAVRTRDSDSVTVVDDAYNAFPESMEAALHATTALAAEDGRRTVAVLGEMVAQGPDSVERHRRIGTLAAELGFAALIVVDGPDSAFFDGTGPTALADAARTAAPDFAVRHARDREEALALACDVIRPSDVVLVKGSHELGLDALADALLTDG